MNYLSHYFTGGVKDRHHYNFGLVLPDFMGVSQRGWKFNKAEDLRSKSPLLAELALGMQVHIKTDALFHSSPFFKESVVQIRRMFEKEEICTLQIRLFFLSHIFLELVLDRIIVKEHPEMVDEFYFALENVEDESLNQFFEVHKSPMPENFLEYLGRFRQYRYIFSYAQDEKLMYAINRIMGRAGQAAIPEEMLPCFKNIVTETEAYLHKEGWQYLTALSNELIKHK